MRCSVCITTRDHAGLLDRTLASIFCQQPPFAWEVIVVDDGANDNTQEILGKYPEVRVIQLPRLAAHVPGRARNVALQAALGDVVIQQSDDVLHVAQDTIERLTAGLKPSRFLIGTVYGYDVATGQIAPRYTPSWNTHPVNNPLFFLGSSSREDVYRVGGYDPDFVTVGCEDWWFSDCLIHGAKSQPEYSAILGLHQEHPRANHDFGPSGRLLNSKRIKGVFCASTGPWVYTPQQPWNGQYLPCPAAVPGLYVTPRVPPAQAPAPAHTRGQPAKVFKRPAVVPPPASKLVKPRAVQHPMQRIDVGAVRDLAFERYLRRHAPKR